MLRETSHFTDSKLRLSPDDAALVGQAVTQIRQAIEKLDLGKENYEAFWHSALKLDAHFQRITGVANCGEQTERAITERALGAKQGVTISTLLDSALERSMLLMSGDTLEQSLARIDELGVLTVHTKDVFIETDPGRSIRGGSGAGIEPPQYEPRLESLIAELQSTGIHKEDLIIRVGAVREAMRRELPYVIVEIPALNKEVIVCNQIGEVTFIALRVHGSAYYASHTKDQLKDNPLILEVVHHSRERWIHEIKELLFRDDPNAVIKRVNVREIESLREVIRASTSAQNWEAMSRAQAALYRVPGAKIGMKALASKFGVTLDPIGHRVARLELGAKIFGEDKALSVELERLKADIETRRLTAEKLSKIIIESGVSAHQWATMNSKQKRSYYIPGSDMGLCAVASCFGVQGNPVTSRAVHLKLGIEIFGDVKELRDELILSQTDREKIAKVVVDSGITAEQWVSMTYEQASTYRVAGTSVGVETLATRLKVQGRPRSSRAVLLDVGLAIFGETDTIRKAIGQMKADLESREIPADHLAKLIIDSGISPHDWATMQQSQKKAYRVPGSDIGIKSLASRFEVEGDPASHHVVHLELGIRIFGAVRELKELLDIFKAQPKELAKLIASSGMTISKWESMSYNQKRLYRVPGSNVGLKALATRFEVTGSPVSNSAVHKELGVKIFIENQPIVPAESE